MDVLANTTFELNPFAESLDSGWQIAGQVATHSSCNAGTMRSIGTKGLEVGKTYVVTYEVSDYKNGSVRVNLGNTQGTSRAAVGIYAETLQVTGTASISFYSDGALSILNNLSFYEVVDNLNNGVTIAFYDGEGTNNKKWGTHYSYSPDLMIKFVNKYLTVKDGALWLQNVNETRNNFYGTQYSSIIQFYVNINPTAVKNFYSMRVQSTRPWGAKNVGDITIFPRMGKPNGQKSRLKTGNFKNYQGNFFADFLRDAADPRYNNELQALMEGALLQGQVMEVTLTNEDTVEVRLLDLDVTVSTQNYSY